MRPVYAAEGNPSVSSLYTRELARRLRYRGWRADMESAPTKGPDICGWNVKDSSLRSEGHEGAGRATMGTDPCKKGNSAARWGWTVQEAGSYEGGQGWWPIEGGGLYTFTEDIMHGFRSPAGRGFGHGPVRYYLLYLGRPVGNPGRPAEGRNNTVLNPGTLHIRDGCHEGCGRFIQEDDLCGKSN